MKGVLFADYIRMIRSQKDIDWARHLPPEDLVYVLKKIVPTAWYPMETFERLGNAILKEVALGDLDAVRMWGRFSVDQLVASFPILLAKGDPVETLMRFRVHRETFFDFQALALSTLVQDHVHVVVSYYMGATAEEAASFQTMGFFERLIELSGGLDVHARFSQKSWAGAPHTMLEVDWRMPD